MNKIYSYLMSMSVPLFLTLTVFANESEIFYDQQVSQIQNGQMLFQCFEGELSCEEQSKIFVDAYLSVHASINHFKTSFETDEYKFENYNFESKKIDRLQFSLADQMRILDEWGFDLRKYFGFLTREEILNLTKAERYVYCFSTQTQACKELKEFTNLFNIEAPTEKMISDLLKNNTPVGQGDRQSLFLLCRQDRTYPCLAVLKNKKGQLLKTNEGGVWSMPMLAYSRKRKPYYKFDGNTPAGVYSINGVMPEANRKLAYGQFRRLILNFIPQSHRESLTQAHLPQSSHDHNWWQEASVARDMGRAHFRVHGAGLGNHNKSSNYYSFVATRGCITTCAELF